MRKMAPGGLLVPVLACLVLAAGCVATKYIPAEGAKSYPPTEDLRVFHSSPPEGTYEILGIVAAEGMNENKLLENLKKKAMSVGAEGLILRRFSELSKEYASERRTEFASHKVRYEGIAIRFKK